MGNAPSPREPDRPPDPTSTQFAVRDRLRKMLTVARGHQRALILTHDNPDPDAVASACGLAHLLQEAAGIHATAAYGGVIGRAENKALIKVLHLPIQPLSRVEPSRHDLLCLVDTQPEVGNYARTNGVVPQLVIDHHPARSSSLMAGFHDVGGPAGATSTMVCRYLRAARLLPGAQLATALFYGIKSDTRDLGREYDPADVDAYNWLLPFIDKPSLS